MSDAAGQQALWSVESLTKAFPGVIALQGVSVDLIAGHVHALVGENGSGKSTLIKILSGVYQPDAGYVRHDGQPIRFSTPKDARSRGVSTIYQEFSLVGSLSVAENIAVGNMPRTRVGLLDRRAMKENAHKALGLVGVSIDPARLVGSLSVAEQQIVEIAKAVSSRSTLLILDEPTTALSGSEVERLHQLLQRLKTPERAILYVSHRLEELEGIADEMTVLRNGSVVRHFPEGKPDMSLVVQAMVGRPIAQFYEKEPHVMTDLALEVDKIHTQEKVSDISFSIRRGEVLGFAGVVGSGRTEVARAIFGMDKVTSGAIRLRGVEVHLPDPTSAIACGVGFVPENRKTDGIFFNLSPVFNTTIAKLSKISEGWWLTKRREKALTLKLFERFQVSRNAGGGQVGQLSGGNQQKLLLARWVFAGADVLILDEPTQGIDIGARQEVYRIINDLTASGVAILLISSDMPELLAMSDRVAVIRRGRIIATMPSHEIDQVTLTELMAGAGKEHS